MRILRIFGLGVLVLVALVLLSGIGVAIINFRDPPLDRPALGYLDPTERAAPSSDDPAFALWAFDAPKGVDPVSVGRALWQAYAALAHVNAARADWPIHMPYVAQPFHFPADLACADLASACVSTYLAHASRVEALVKSDQYLLDRLAAIDADAHWHEIAPPASPGVPIARLADLSGVFSLSLAQASIEIEGGHPAQGVARLEQDTRIARRILGGSDSLLSKMVAAAMLRRSLLAYSELLSAASAQPPLIAALSTSLVRSTSDLSSDERSLLAPLRYEARTLYRLTLQLVGASGGSARDWRERLALWSTPFLLLPRATANLEATLWDIQAPMMNASTREFGQNQRPIQKRYVNAAEALGQPSWRSVYNPLGKIFASNAPDLTDFAARVFDDEVLMHAVRAKAYLMAQGVHFAQAERFLDDAQPSMRDPYSGAAFSWRPGDSAIALPERGAHGVTLVRVPLGAA